MKNEILPAADQGVPMTPLAAMDLITLSPERFTSEVYLPYKTKLALAIDEVRSVNYDITTTAGMKVAVECRAMFRDLRIAADKERKARKAPITAIGKLLEAGYDAVVERATPLEELFDADIAAEVERKEAVKQAAVAAELARTKAIEARIEAIRNAPLQCSGWKSADIEIAHGTIAAIDIDASFQEYIEDASMAKGAALSKMAEALSKAKASEDAAAKLAADQLAVEQERKRLQEERAETERKNTAYLAKMRADADAALEAERATIKAANDAAEAERLQQQQAVDASNEAARLERERVEQENAALRAQLAALTPATVAAPAQALEAIPEAEAPAPEPVKVIPIAPGRPSDQEIIQAVADRFHVTAETALEWVLDVVKT